MLKFVACELLKSYVKNKAKISPSDYFVGIFAVGGFVTLMVADYIYLQNPYKPIGVLLICCTILLAIALFIKIISFYLRKNSLYKEPANFLVEIIPLIIRTLPIGVISFILWEIIKIKFSSKLRKLQRKE